MFQPAAVVVADLQWKQCTGGRPPLAADLLEDPAADVCFIAALAIEASGAAVSGETWVPVIASAAGAAAASATAVGADCCGPSNRENIGISTFSDWNHSNSVSYWSHSNSTSY